MIRGRVVATVEFPRQRAMSLRAISGHSMREIEKVCFLWDRNFGALDINTLIRANDPLRGFHFGVATQINSSGMLIADADLGPGKVNTGGRYLLMRVPEPGMVPMLALALVALGFFYSSRSLSRSRPTR